MFRAEEDQNYRLRLTLTEETNDPGLYSYFKLSEASAYELHGWCLDHAIPNPVTPSNLHLTCVYSTKTIVYTPYVYPVTLDPRSFKMDVLGEALTLLVSSEILQSQSKRGRNAGAKNIYDSYIPHITLSYKPTNVDVGLLKPPGFPLLLEREFVRDLQKGNPSKDF